MSKDVSFYLDHFKNNVIPLPSGNKFHVYALWDKDEIVYIGQSMQVEFRIKAHQKNKTFDSYSLYECADANSMELLETTLIFELQPKYNVLVGSGYESVLKLRKRIQSISEYHKYSSEFYVNKIKKKLKDSEIELFDFKGSLCVKQKDVQKAIDYILEGE